jgi:hypothetical protein
MQTFANRFAGNVAQGLASNASLIREYGRQKADWSNIDRQTSTPKHPPSNLTE